MGEKGGKDFGKGKPAEKGGFGKAVNKSGGDKGKPFDKGFKK